MRPYLFTVMAEVKWKPNGVNRQSEVITNSREHQIDKIAGIVFSYMIHGLWGSPPAAVCSSRKHPACAIPPQFSRRKWARTVSSTVRVRHQTNFFATHAVRQNKSIDNQASNKRGYVGCKRRIRKEKKKMRKKIEKTSDHRVSWAVPTNFSQNVIKTSQARNSRHAMQISQNDAWRKL